MCLLERGRDAGTSVERTKQRFSVEAHRPPGSPDSKQVSSQGLRGRRNISVDTAAAPCPVRRLGSSTGQMAWVLQQINDQEEKVGAASRGRELQQLVTRAGLGCEQTSVT